MKLLIRSVLSSILACCLILLVVESETISAFQCTSTSNSIHQHRIQGRATTVLYVTPPNKKNPKTKLTKEELSYLQTRDMTREEMIQYNAQTERVMNQELTYMTIFSFIISAPLLYLAWVGLFAETNEIAM